MAKISPKWLRLINSYSKCFLQFTGAKGGSTYYWIIGCSYFPHLVFECCFTFWKKWLHVDICVFFFVVLTWVYCFVYQNWRGPHLGCWYQKTELREGVLFFFPMTVDRSISLIHRRILGENPKMWWLKSKSSPTVVAIVSGISCWLK